MTLPNWPTPRRKRLVRHAAEFRGRTENGLGLDQLRLELSRIVIDKRVDKDGKEHDIYLLPHEAAAIVSYCYALHPAVHDMHTV